MILRIIFISLLFWSCSSAKQTQKTETETNPKPSWTSSRPIDGNYYIGIGSASKLSFPTDYSIIAKKNALSDMSSEITVQISGESFYHTIDRDNQYSEDFQSMVRSTFKEEITDYDIVGSWENEREFWIFTRISKAKHQQIKAEKKTAVLDQAYDNYTKAKYYADSHKPADALDLLSTALLSMQEYWAESNPYATEEGLVNLDNQIYNEIRSICSSMDLKSSSNEVILDYDNGFSSDFSVAVQQSENYLSNIPLKYKIDSEKYSRPKNIYTNSEGIATIHVENTGKQKTNFYLNVWIDFENLLLHESSPFLTEMLLNSINQNTSSYPIKVELPKVFVNDGSIGFSSLSEAFKSELQKNGIQIVSKPELADLDLSITGAIKPGGSSQGFELAFIDFSVYLEDHKSHRQLYSDSFQNVKGIHMNTSGAEGDAENNAAKKIKKEIVPKMLKILL